MDLICVEKSKRHPCKRQFLAVDEAEQQELAALMAEYGRSVLRRAKAVVLLLARGKSLPVLTPLAPAP